VKFFDLEFPFHSSSISDIPSTHIYLDSQVTHILPVSNNSVPSFEDKVKIPHEDAISDTEERDDDAIQVPIRKSSRNSQAPIHLQDYICGSTNGNYPMNKFVSYSNLSPKHIAYAFSLNAEIEPNSFFSSSRVSRWLTAMQAEIEALNINNTWEFIDPPPDAIPIGTKWVYKIKKIC